MQIATSAAPGRTLGWVAKTTGSMALGYAVPLACFAGVSLDGFCAPLVLPPPGNTSLDARPLIAGRIHGL